MRYTRRRTSIVSGLKIAVPAVCLCILLSWGVYALFFSNGGSSVDTLVSVAQNSPEAVSGTGSDTDTQPDSPPDLPDGKSLSAEQQTEPPEPQGPEIAVVSGVVGSGDTASGILDEYLSPADIYAMDNACKPVFKLASMRRGQPWSMTTADGDFSAFRYEIDTENCLVIEREGEAFNAYLEPIEYDVETVRVDGVINSSLYEAISDTGEGPALAVRLADIFGWEIDFIREIRQGDKFTVFVDKRYRDGEFTGYGTIHAAAFTNQGEYFEGYRFEDEHGNGQYYTSEGRNLRRAFLKAPLSFKRISSNYSPRRLHPILKVYRPHNGIDYAAPTGTPVHAIGDGTVITVSRTKAAGRYVKIRHANGYESSYLHLSGYGKGIRSGTRVRQGQTIGYVGSTGYATGPHLDFRMRKNGTFINPRKATNPRAHPVPQEKMEQFKNAISDYYYTLNPQVALHEQPHDGDVPESDS